MNKLSEIAKAHNLSRTLQKQNAVLQKSLDAMNSMKAATLNNSMFSLVQSAFSQANMTSFNPIVQSNIYAPLTINWTMLTYMYKTHGILQTAIDVPVLDALRDGVILHSDELEPDEIKDLEDDIEDQAVLDVVKEALIWQRLYGGGAIIINTNQDPAEPLSLKGIRKLELYACNRWELMAPWKIGTKSQELNPWLRAASATSDCYDFYGERIHHTRVLTFVGKAAPYIIRWQLQGWGMSEYERMVEDFNAYIKTKEVLYDLLQEAKIDVYQIDGLRNQLVSDAGTEATRKRIQAMNQFKNFNNAILLDKLDLFDQKQLTFSGIADIMKENRMGIASALRMPISKIFGVSSTGFASGEDDIENYNSMVKSEIRTPLKRKLRTIFKLMTVAKFGEEFDLDIEYHPMRDLSAVDEETVKTSKQNRYFMYYDRNLMSAKEIGEVSNKEKLLPMETDMSKGILDDHPMPAGDGREIDAETGEPIQEGRATAEEGEKEKGGDEDGR